MKAKSLSQIMYLLVIGFLLWISYEPLRLVPITKQVKNESTPEPSNTATFSISGYGAPRVSEVECLTKVNDFEKKLNSFGLVSVKKTSCINASVLNQEGFYLPYFKVLSKNQLSTETVYGAKFSSEAFCNIERLRLEKENMKIGLVLDSSCNEISNQKKNEEIYQPVIVILSRSAKPRSISGS